MTTPSSDTKAPVDSPTPTNLERWGIEIALPPGATWSYNAHYPKADVVIERNELATVEMMTTAPPATLEEAAEMWDRLGGKDTRVLDQGTTESGLFYSARTFQVRVGVPERRGLHRWQHISRVYGLLPLTDGSYIQCTVYLEYGLDITAEHPNIQRALKLCTSMKRAQ